MAVIRTFDLKWLKPFRRSDNRLPKPAPEKADEFVDLDPALKPDEQSYVSHYLGYADILLNGTEEGPSGQPRPPNNIIELPLMEDLSGSAEPENNDTNDKDKVA